MIDFTNCKINKFRYYGGKNRGKICIIYNNEQYMLKFPGINDEDETNARVYAFPTSALKEDGKKINYFEYIISLKNEDCNSAIMRIVPLIDLNKINNIIEQTPEISEIRKEFYKKIIKERYEKILLKTYTKIKER